MGYLYGFMGGGFLAGAPAAQVVCRTPLAAYLIHIVQLALPNSKCVTPLHSTDASINHGQVRLLLAAQAVLSHQELTITEKQSTLTVEPFARPSVNLTLQKEEGPLSVTTPSKNRSERCDRCSARTTLPSCRAACVAGEVQALALSALRATSLGIIQTRSQQTLGRSSNGCDCGRTLSASSHSSSSGKSRACTIATHVKGTRKQ